MGCANFRNLCVSWVFDPGVDVEGGISMRCFVFLYISQEESRRGARRWIFKIKDDSS